MSDTFDLPGPRPTLNILVVVARPDGPEDVGYRTISRPLLDALRTAGWPATVDLVRPGTWQALRDHLETATGQHGPPHWSKPIASGGCCSLPVPGSHSTDDGDSCFSRPPRKARQAR
jgi:hypothetical protein